jgi:hypothetical protein
VVCGLGVRVSPHRALGVPSPRRTCWCPRYAQKNPVRACAPPPEISRGGHGILPSNNARPWALGAGCPLAVDRRMGGYQAIMHSQRPSICAIDAPWWALSAVPGQAMGGRVASGGGGTCQPVRCATELALLRTLAYNMCPWIPVDRQLGGF